MKSRIIAWSFGLLGLSTLAGCGWEGPFRNSCNTCNNGCGVNTGRGGSASATMRSKACNVVDTIAAALRPDEPWEWEPIARAKRQAPPVAAVKKNGPPSTAASAIPQDRPATVPLQIVPLPATPKSSTPTFPDPEQPQPLPKETKKLVMPPAANLKPLAGASLPPEPTRQAEAADADLHDALNRMVDKRESLVVLHSTHFQYAQTDNFQQLTGQVQQWRKTWRLRYASVSADDLYGGSVVLEGAGDLHKLRDGQHVRVRGRLVPPETRQDSARYVVSSMEVLD